MQQYVCYITKNDVVWHIPTVQMLGRELSVPVNTEAAGESDLKKGRALGSPVKVLAASMSSPEDVSSEIQPQKLFQSN